jgi:Bax protein
MVVLLALGLAGSWPERGDRAWPEAVARASLPTTLAHAVDGALSPGERKARFVAYLLPLVDRVNAAILEERGVVLRLRERIAAGRGLAPEERRLLVRIGDRYGVDGEDFDRLLARVDVVPPSLALAQAALESGWGTSRLAREDNALFGERAWTNGQGAVPAYRRFPGVLASIRAYALNLNRHRAYEGFRLARAALRAHGWLDGYVLAGSIGAYSEIGPVYVTQVRAIIRTNRLGRLDRTILNG